jgi:probable HAF family extracellular repeat protein
MQHIGTVDRPSYANDINEPGQVVGTILGPDQLPHPFVWSPADGMQDLTYIGAGFLSAQAINNRGQVLGRDRVVTLKGR